MAVKYESLLSIKVESEAFINQQARATTLNLIRGLVLATPVDQGFARSNWQTSEGRPITSEITEDVNRNGSLSIAIASRATNAARSIPYPLFYARNNLPYIERLNAGWSEQAPAKFVEQVIDRVVRQ